MKRTSKTEEVPEGSGEARSDSKAGHPLSRRKNVLRGAAFIVCVLFLLAAVLFWRLSGQGRKGEPVSVPQEAVMAGTAGEGAYFLLSAMEDAQEQIQVESCMALSDGENFSLSGTAQRIPANDDGRFYLVALEVYVESVPGGGGPGIIRGKIKEAFQLVFPRFFQKRAGGLGAEPPKARCKDPKA